MNCRHFRLALIIVSTLVPLAPPAVLAQDQPQGIARRPVLPRIQAFCIDFNWYSGKFADPGQFAQADPKEHLEWYRKMGVNTIQTFAVSCNGYAWYKGGKVVPPQPGMKHDFLVDLVRLGHADGRKVMGYFCVGANTRWGKENPDYSYGTPSGMHLPFTTKYLDFLCESMTEALTISGMDGFMIDWVFNPARPGGKWLDSEKQTYRELMGKDFPADGKLSAADLNAFQRASVDRCWGRIHKATKAANPRAALWLSCHNLSDPQVKGSRMFQQIDWLMNEHPDFAALIEARKAVGPQTKIIQCVCGWGSQHNTTRIIRGLGGEDVGFYGFAEPDPQTTLPPTSTLRLAGNAWNIERMRRAFLNIERPVQPQADGSIVLAAILADTSGPSPIYFSSGGQEHIGWWGNPADTVSWTFYAPRDGQYSVSLTYSCDKGAGGSEFSVSAGKEVIAGKTQETGSWSTYATCEVGKLKLAGPGLFVLTVKPAAGKAWKSMGLKAVTLKPAP